MKNSATWLEHEMQRGQQDGNSWAQKLAGTLQLALPSHTNKLGLHPKAMGG